MQVGGVQGRNGEENQNRSHEIPKELINRVVFFLKKGAIQNLKGVQSLPQK